MKLLRRLKEIWLNLVEPRRNTPTPFLGMVAPLFYCRECGREMRAESLTSTGHEGEWWLQVPCPCGGAIFVTDKDKVGKWSIDPRFL